MAAVLAVRPSALKPHWKPETTVPLTNEESDAFSDDSDMSDATSDSSSIRSPTASKTEDPTVSSPSAVDDVAVDTSAVWPTRRARRKRTRMSADERKVRHREVQRQFMKRKRARIAELRIVQAGVERQLRLLSLYQELKQLKAENDSLAKQLVQSGRASAEREPSPSAMGLVFSVPLEDEYSITAHEWNEIFDVLSDEAGVDSDSGLSDV